MAYETNSASSLDDFWSKLNTFAAANGWTTDEHAAANNRLALHRGGCYVQFRWDDTNNTTGVYQSLAYTGTGTQMGAQSGDSGLGAQGANGSSITTGRRLNTIGIPFTRYHFFADTSPAPYIHGVIEYAAGLYRHFSFGELVKIGTWTGGEYSSSTYWGSSTSAIDLPIETNEHSIVFDSQSTIGTTLYATAIHMEGMPNQAGAGRWGVSHESTSMGSDRAGNARVSACSWSRGGPYHIMMAMGYSRYNGFRPLFPIPVFYIDRVPSPDNWYLIGNFPNVRYVNLDGVDVGEELSIGGETWACFPFTRKLYNPSSSFNQEQSYNWGLAYRKT